MTICNCKHESVCKYKIAIVDAVEKILETHFGGINPKWGGFEKAVRQSCRYREEKLN